jgi:uncharacterized protein YfaS (alpha-2-macroglobulin family)
VTLNNKGEAEVDLNTTLKAKSKSQIYSIEVSILDGSQEPAFSRKNVIIYAGEYGIYKKDYTYGGKVNTPMTLPLALVPYKAAGKIDGIALTADIERHSWIAHQEPNKKYPTYTEETEKYPSTKITSDGQGNASLSFTPTKTGSYTITIQGKDGRNNTISKEFYLYSTSEDFTYYSQSRQDGITVLSDKEKYEPEKDTAQITIKSLIPDRDVFFTLQRGRVDRYQIIHMTGTSATVDIPIKASDVPNMYATARSFSDTTLEADTKGFTVAPEGKKLQVTLTPNSKTYGPGETVKLNLQTTDTAGNPVTADVAVWSVDKAIFELSDSKLGNIFDAFWYKRENYTWLDHSLEGITIFQGGGGGGCFVKGTPVLMADGKLKNIEDIQENEYVLTRKSVTDPTLVKAKVLKTKAVQEAGYMIINEKLKVTADHLLNVNNEWKEAGSVQPGDTLRDDKNNKVTVFSLEYQNLKADVYNLEIETYHTYFAQGVWVHNDKGTSRSTFKDTAYWNPSVHTDANGRASLTFKLPDNLTTWTLAAVAATQDTRVGQTTTDIVVTKDIIARPILPNILRVGDETVVSALIQNFTATEQTLDISLDFDAGGVEERLRPDTVLKANTVQQFSWTIKPTTEKEKAKLVFSVTSKKDKKTGDIVTQEIPVRQFGFQEKRAEVGEGNKSFTIKLAQDSHKEKSSVTLSLAATTFGTLRTAMNYLIQYPYGCVEQTTSRFVPAVIAKVNASLFGDALKDKKLDDIIEKGIVRLQTQQQYNGGWTWYFTGDPDPYITAYVVEYLLEAKQAGAAVDESIFNRAKNYLEQQSHYNQSLKIQETYSREELIAKNYGLSLLKDTDKIRKITNLDNLSPDFLALNVMANYRSGDTNPDSNGLTKLVSLAHTQGEGVYWDAGTKENFGSKDASTALAIRAILTAKGDMTLATKASLYLTRTRRAEYWSNTYATAQVTRALTDLAKATNELNPNYTYTVILDGSEIAKGSITSANQNTPDIQIPVNKIAKNGSTVTLTMKGEGQLYSTMAINEYHTDRESEPVSHGLTITREYVNEKGPQYSLGLGDTVYVSLTVSGLKSDEPYAVIQDELPAGLVPINKSFRNTQAAQDGYNDLYYGIVSDNEITENGMTQSIFRLYTTPKTYSYTARVVSRGTFIVPPATVSMMYSPELYARTAPQTVTIDEKSELLPEKLFEPNQIIQDLKETSQKSPKTVIVSGIIIITITILDLVLLIGLMRAGKNIDLKRLWQKIKEKIKRSPQKDMIE